MIALQTNRHVHLLLLLASSIYFLLAFNSVSLAGPAAPFVREISQPDGTKFKVKLKGDEWLHWHETEDGYAVMKDKATSWWHYAMPDEVKGIRMSGHQVGKVMPEQLDIKKGLRPVRKRPSVSPEKAPGLKSPAPKNATALPRTQNLLAIIVDFNNVQGTYTPDSFQSLMFSTTSKSVVDYYDEVSYGNLHIVPATETYGNGDGIAGWLRLNQNHPDCENAFDSDACYQSLVSSAILAADPYVNFSSFDTNGDNTISSDELSIFIIAAGYEYSAGGTGPGVWAHMWYLYSPLTLDGKSISQYAIIGEKEGDHQSAIGGFVHELGHLMLGWPDLYDTDGGSGGNGYFDLMSMGGWCKTNSDMYDGQTPTHPSAWLKEYSGFVTPVVITNQAGASMPAVSGTSTVIVKVPTQNANEYFLLENRYMTGYDAGLQGCLNVSQTSGGIALWHINKSPLNDGCITWNNCNNNEKQRLVDLEEADGVQDLDTSNGRSKLQDLFYAGNNTAFTDVTNPNNRFYDGISNGISVNNISVYGSIMTADIAAFTGTPSAPANQLLNSGFESGKTNWIEYSSGGYSVITQDSQYSFGGSWFGWMGGYSNATEYVYQDLTIPSDAAQAYIQFWYYIGTAETTTSNANDTLTFEVVNQVDNKLLKTLGTLSNLNDVSSWIVSEQYNVSDFIGRSIRLRFYAKTNHILSTEFLIDNLSLMVVGRSGTEMPSPAAVGNYTYTAVASPVLSQDPAAAKPLAIGDINSGILSLQAGFLGFSKPVDIYLAVSTSYDSKIYMIKSDNSLQPVTSGLAKWRENTIGPVDASLYGNISTSSLTSGTYYLYAAVTPAGSTSVYYMWSTSFEVP